MNTNKLEKIDVNDGSIITAAIYFYIGNGSKELKDTAEMILGASKLNSFLDGKLVRGLDGSCKDHNYCLDREQVEKWNTHIEEQELLEKAKALTPEDGRFFGEGGHSKIQTAETIEISLITKHQLRNGAITLFWDKITDGFLKTEKDTYYYSRPVKETDPLMDRAIELAVDGIEILGYGRQEGYEWNKAYEYSFISLNSPELNGIWCNGYSHTQGDQIFFQRKIKEETDPLMERAIELAVNGIEILGYGPPELDQIEDGYEYDFISDPTDDLDSFTTASTITSSVFHDDTDIYFKRKIKSSPDLSALTPHQLKNYHRDKWLELINGEKPKDPNGHKNGTLYSVAKALYGNNASE